MTAAPGNVLRVQHLTRHQAHSLGKAVTTGMPGMNDAILQTSPFSFMTVYLLHCSNPRMTVPLHTNSASS